MKKLLILASILIAKITLAQNKDTVGLHTPFTNGEVVYHKTFKAPGKPTAVLYNNSRLWFEKRYNGPDSLTVQDRADGNIAGKGWEVLTFKGPLNMDVPSRAGMTIEINSKNDGYTVHLSHIILGYQEEPGKAYTYFTAEDLLNHVLGKKYPKGTLDPVPFNKKRSKKALESLNVLVANIMTSIE